MTWIIEWYLNSKIMHKYIVKKLNNIKMAILMANELLWKKEWHRLNTNNQNKPKMARFLKFKFQTILKLKFNWGQFYKKMWNFGCYKKL